NDPQLTSLTNYTYRSIRDTDERFLTSIGALLHIMGDHGKAAKFYKKFLENIKLDDGKRATALHNLGLCYSSAGDYTTAINYYLQALKLKQENHRPLEESMYNLGIAYAHLKQYNFAREYLQWALTSALMSPDKYELIANLYDNIAVITGKEGNFEEEQKYYGGLENLTGKFTSCSQSHRKPRSNSPARKRSVPDSSVDFMEAAFRLEIFPMISGQFLPEITGTWQESTGKIRPYF
ncbi:unnamed protein product, partial [Rotaria socialis]